MAYNIQMNYFDGSSYQELYPNTKDSSVQIEIAGLGDNLNYALNAINNFMNSSQSWYDTVNPKIENFESQINSLQRNLDEKTEIADFSYIGTGSTTGSINVSYIPDIIIITESFANNIDDEFSYFWGPFGIGWRYNSSFYLFFIYGSNASYACILNATATSSKITWNISSSRDIGYCCNSSNTTYFAKAIK